MPSSNRQITLLLAWLVFATAGPLLSAQSDTDLFELEIRPLLAKHCLQCHGEEKQESGLRLDSPAAWEKGGVSGRAIVAGKPAESLVLLAVKKTDPDLQMPPGDRQLSQREIASLERWIKAGAIAPRQNNTAGEKRLTLKDAAHFWSFQPLVRPPVPLARPVDRWSRTAIDRFVHAQMTAAGLTPVADADRRTLIRRATLDLTGLPPSPEEIAEFLADDGPGAFERLVDRLLESSAYGERWGRHWLDVARYADTAGDGADYPVREAIKYRDWVVQAFNKDQPYDEFLREQIAGDILAVRDPDARYASRVTATGFLAIGKRYGYKPSPDYQHLDFADVIDSLGRSLLGLTLGCARCHDHKYDPVSTRDYYALYGILQSTTWAFPGGEEQKHPSHFPALVPAEQVNRLEQQRATELASVAAEIAALEKVRRELDVDWIAGGHDLGMENQPVGKPLTVPWVCAGPIEVRAESQSPYRNVHPVGSRGVHVGSGLPTDGIRYVFKDGLKATPGKQIHFNIDFRTQQGAQQTGAYRIYLGQGVIQSLCVEFSVTPTSLSLRNGSQWEMLRKLETGKWYSLQVTISPESKTYSGSIGAPGDITSFKDKGIAPNWNGIIDCFICDGIGHLQGPAAARDMDNIGLRESPFLPLGCDEVKARVLTETQQQHLKTLKKRLAELAARKQETEKKPLVEVAYGVSEGSPVNAQVQLRGEPQRLGEEVPRRFLEVLGGDGLPEGHQGSGREYLAEWITRPDNPLTPRVWVNRVWQWHFGRGIVSTPSDFGLRGARPTHPDLLDWLASEFVAHGWSSKWLHREIMRSRVYQLSSADQEVGEDIDPENTFLWHFARRPLDAESMRDAMLAVSRNLDRSLPGPHPFPEVKTWGFTIHHPFHAVYESNHRSIYLMQQRNRRHPYLELFDSADPNVSIGLRQPTVTPTQALYLMNSRFVHEQAEGLAQRLLEMGGTSESRLEYAFEIVHGRQPSEDDFESTLQFLKDYQQRLPQPETTESRLRAWSAVSRVMLTSNSFLFVD